MSKHSVAVRALFLTVTLAAGFSGVAPAQPPQPPFQCFANGGVSTPARFEGISEMVGDLVVQCIGGVTTAPGAAIPVMDVQIFLNTALTSRLLTSSSAGPQYSEALLILDEPAPGFQYACVGAGNTTVCPGYGNGLGTANAPSLVGYYGSGVPGTSVTGCTQGVTLTSCPGNNKNVFQAIQTTPNSVTFLGVPIDPPGISGSRVIRITNIRGNANALGVAGANATPTPIVETISPTPSQFLPVANPSQTVAFIQRSLTSGVSASPNFSQCASQNKNLANDPSQSGASQLNVRFVENFATVFKRRNVATSSSTPTALANQDSLTIGTYNTESSFYNGLFPTIPGRGSLALSGLADQGTRLFVYLQGIPAGVSLFSQGLPPVSNCPDVNPMTGTDA